MGGSYPLPLSIARVRATPNGHKVRLGHTSLAYLGPYLICIPQDMQSGIPQGMHRAYLNGHDIGHTLGHAFRQSLEGHTKELYTTGHTYGQVTSGRTSEHDPDGVHDHLRWIAPSV